MNRFAGARKPRHIYPEAFMLMQYETDDGKTTEWIWNSRDGVSPFCVHTPDGQEMMHVRWNEDRYAPNHVPKPGDRIFVTVTAERARELAISQVERFWDDPQYPMREAFASMGEAVDALAKDIYGDGDRPTIEVVGSPAGGSGDG